ncbi:hypothetical protein H2204_001334 [Knufia peltigerae]|uniref:CorA-like transporter domain-containing protein n=1 Tax=Knufia peltigerae TaxID=1002370 RepID=A0AA38YD31_9EURO|nr:hypothetical protein H2204_001334 [Knufia peltigerae]
MTDSRGYNQNSLGPKTEPASIYGSARKTANFGMHVYATYLNLNHTLKPKDQKANFTLNDMMSEILSYHQVMPSFIDLMASFGRGAPYDYQYCGFRSDIRLSMRNSALAVPRIKRSGQVLELCYSLRAVEPSTSLLNWPWSIKQLAVSHTIDVETGQSTWLVFKADDTIKDRIMSATRSASLPQVNAFQDANEALASSFGIHLILCQWAAEHWRWYVNFLEQKVQDITRVKVFGAVEPPRSPRSARQALAKINPAARSATFSLSKTLSRISTWGSVRQSSQRSRGSAPDLSEHVSTPGLSENSTNQLLTKKEVIEEDEDVGFSLDDLQQIQHIEEQIQQAMLVQTTAVKVLEQLRNFYQSLQEHPEWHLNLSPASRGSLTRFCNHIENIQFDLNSQYTRSETLVTLLANRKNLLGQILEWRSTEAIKLISRQSHASTEHMESMTDEMRELAVKTKQETVSMRIITLVTLFFLPGTFISTLMSTDIVQYDHSKEIFSKEALKLFLAVSLPMMLFTFLAWYAVYWCVNHREKVAKFKQQLRMKSEAAV